MVWSCLSSAGVQSTHLHRRSWYKNPRFLLSAWHCYKNQKHGQFKPSLFPHQISFPFFALDILYHVLKRQGNHSGTQTGPNTIKTNWGAFLHVLGVYVEFVSPCYTQAPALMVTETVFFLKDGVAVTPVMPRKVCSPLLWNYTPEHVTVTCAVSALVG